MFCIKLSFFWKTQSFYSTQLYLYCHSEITWLIAFLYSRIVLVETKGITFMISMDVSVCVKEERECSVQRLNVQYIRELNSVSVCVVSELTCYRAEQV